MEELFRRSGITAGMHVLDLCSGAGDVAMLAGRLVRPGGTVVGLEQSAESVALATQRVAAAAKVAVRFEVCDVDTYQPGLSRSASLPRLSWHRSCPA